MSATDVTCPSCGATREVHNPGVIMIVCEYCDNAIYWDKEKIENAGKQATLPEGFSRLYRGATGSLMRTKRFVVLGRARYSFGRGFWDEWFLEFADGSTAWLTEDNHEFALETEVKDADVPGFESLRPMSQFALNDTTFVVQEVGLAKCVGVEGDLPHAYQTGEEYPYADASSPDGRYTLGIEYDEIPPTVFKGRWLKFAQIQVDDEGLEW